MNDWWCVVAIVAAVGFGIAVGYPVGRRNGRADRIDAAARRRVAMDIQRVTGDWPLCDFRWSDKPGGKTPPNPVAHRCASPETHPMEHRCKCGALYPS